MVDNPPVNIVNTTAHHAIHSIFISSASDLLIFQMVNRCNENKVDG